MKKKEILRVERKTGMKGPFEEAKDRHFHFRGERRAVADGWRVPGPVGLKEGWVVDDEGQEHWKRPQQEGWEELGNDWALDGTARWLINETEEGLQCSIKVMRFNSISNSDPQTLHRPRDVELVHRVDDDGGSGEEEEQQEEEDVEEDTAEPPARSTHWQIFPGDGRK